MHLSQAPPTLLSLFFTLLLHTESARAVAIPAFNFGFGLLEKRGNCGAQLQYTCNSGEGCFTTNNIAFCSSTAAGGYGVYTTTYTETDLILRTSTYTSYPAAVTTPVTEIASCLAAPTEFSCGTICCASTQGCLYSGSCTESPSTLWSYASMPVATVTNTIATASAPVRPTSGSTTTITTSATTTVPFIAPATATGSTLPITVASSSHHLSAGAIAGIVIGVLAGILLLLLLCFCCLGITIFDSLLALFGLGKKKKRRTTERVEVTERYSRHGSASAGARRETHTNWLGRPTRVTERKEKKSSGLGGIGAVGAGLAGLALILGLKRKHDKKTKIERSEIGSTYYTDSYTGTLTSASSASSRTRESRRQSRR